MENFYNNLHKKKFSNYSNEDFDKIAFDSKQHEQFSLIMYNKEADSSKEKLLNLEQQINKRRAKSRTMKQRSSQNQHDHYQQIMKKLNEDHFEEEFKLREQQVQK